MYKFKLGDKVKRLPEYCGGTFREDRVYVIRTILGPERIRLEGLTGIYDTYKFKLEREKVRNLPSWW